MIVWFPEMQQFTCMGGWRSRQSDTLPALKHRAGWNGVLFLNVVVLKGCQGTAYGSVLSTGS